MPGSVFTSGAAPARRALRGLALAVALGAAIAVAGWHLPGEIHRLNNVVAAADGRTPAERRLPAASEFGIDVRAFTAARGALPPDAVFAVAVPPGDRDIAVLAFPSLAAHALLPRRWTLEPAGADWLVAYRVDPALLGLEIGRVERLAPDVVLAELR